MDTTETLVPSTPEDPAQLRAAEKLAGDWLAALEDSVTLEDQWRRRVEKISRLYLNQEKGLEDQTGLARFNIFWSNLATLIPATYSRPPRVEVARRWNDSDPVGRVAAMVLQRALQYEVDKDLNLHQALQQVVLDRMLGGRGSVWVRYQPSFTPREVQVPGAEGTLQTESYEELSDEFTPVDYVHWKDLRVSRARTWQDVRWMARAVPYSKETLEGRFRESFASFGGDIASVPQDTVVETEVNSTTGQPPTGAENTSSEKRTIVFEICDKDTRQFIWVVKGQTLPLDVKNDPYELENYFPSPKPLYATLSNDSLIPTPDYVYYQGQIRELNTITERINLLTKALRVVGVYDQSQQALKDLLQTGRDSQMVPVNAWAAFAEKGGLKGVMDFLPIETVIQVLQGLYVAREQVKTSVYEITGVSDILRGQSAASETLGAQKIKAQFANLRLQARKAQVAEFVTQVLCIKGEMMCTLYDPQTLARISAADQLEEVKANPQVLHAALQLLKNERLRGYRLQIQSDSMVEVDEAEEASKRNDFMSAVSNFMLAMKNVVAVGPEMVPVALEMLKFVVRGFRVGMGLEYAIEGASAAIMKRMSEPKQEPPSPEQIKLMIAQLQEKGDTLRAQLKEDAATDREELKAAVAVALQEAEAATARVIAAREALDQPSAPPQGAPV